MISAKPRCEYFKCLPPSECILITILYISSSSRSGAYINRTCCLHSSWCCWLLQQSPVALHVLIKESNILILLLAFRHLFLEKSREMHKKCRWVLCLSQKSGPSLSLCLSLPLSHPALPTTTTTVLLGETGRNIMRWKAATLACSPL